LWYFAGDPTVGYENITEPTDGGAPSLIMHDDERCRFHQFFTLTDVPMTGTPGQFEPSAPEPRHQAWHRRDVD
jgi:hypothetical protein